ncbi:MAG TPA: response regulator [Anaerolineaceae bacterium]|nr:response regulator [Anaerolineaceae bacterium]
MARILLIDDEPIFYKMIDHALKPSGYVLEYAKTGMDGLKAVLVFNPDVIIVDVRLPDVDGFEVVKRLRRTPRYAGIPILFLTSHNELNTKLKAFEVGADDYLVKPFQPEELVARIGLLVRKSEIFKSARPSDVEQEQACITTIHSLRGGVGCSSMAVNLAVAYYNLWGRPTLLMDTDMHSGQIALMLNVSPVHTFDDLTSIQVSEIDDDLIRTITTRHTSGVDFIAAPTMPVADDAFTDELWPALLKRLSSLYEFIVIDTSHSFNNISIYMLNAAEHIFLMMAPDMVSIRAAINSIQLYNKLGYSQEKISPILNQTLPTGAIKQQQIEKVLKIPIRYSIPHSPSKFIRAINFGKPILSANPDAPVTTLFEDIAYEMSKETLKNIPPAAPSPTWKRVSSRFAAKK